MNEKIFAAFDRGQVPTISCINKATVPLGVDFSALVAAHQKFLSDHFVPVWGTPANLIVAPDFVKGAWAIVLLDNADVAGALGYHELTPDGFPLSKVFVKTSLKNGDKVSVTVCHELCEMLVDPAINMCFEHRNGVIYAGEVCDAVEALEFDVDGVAMSDFQYPAYFEAFRLGSGPASKTKFDHLGKITKPFQILRGGYMPVKKGNRWTQIFGSNAKRRAFAREDRRGHRTELRPVVAKRGIKALKRSRSRK